MRLFEAILEANHRALAGDSEAGLRPADYAEELPIIALTCVDPRLNRLLPQVLGVPGEQFIWLRNGGNIVTGPMSSTMRSIALACAVKGGREIAVIGHTDCQVCRATTMQLVELFKAQGIERGQLPANLNEFFGTSGSERVTVLKAVDFIRQSPVIGPGIPVHGLLVDTESGRLEWLVNGYEQMALRGAASGSSGLGTPVGGARPLDEFKIGEMAFPQARIGEVTVQAPSAPQQPEGTPKPPRLPEKGAEAPPRLPLTPAYRPKFQLRRGARR
jgi:carbonic anhydrase